ncbi:MAG: LytR C-terminal domain-containing protein [Mycobacteriaceae bacterium]|nr:LytR C-terminal domain-containing protein [Mycobacteriaceae bacterium]MBV9640418.1 LytR C-terminal domain-containing protein [Mycobacteriaceae bacterium]
MNERVPDSSGLPLRAMVMVLLFLGVIFLLIGFQAMGSSSSPDDHSTSTVTTITSTPSAAASPAAATADVRVYNVSSDAGVAGRTADRLKQAGWNVTDVGNLSLTEVTETTVFFSDAGGEQQAADQVGQLLQAPVQPRVPALADQPPGVIVAVTG